MLKLFRQYKYNVSGVLQFIWQYIDVVEKGCHFLAHLVCMTLIADMFPYASRRLDV